MAYSTIGGTADVVNIPGRLKCGAFDPPNESVTDDTFSTDPDKALSAEKQQHQYTKVIEQARGTDVAARTTGFHIAYATGEVVSVSACLQTPSVSGATVTVNVLKNGTTVLSADAVIDDADAAYAVVTATINPSLAAYVAGDVFECAVTVSGGANVGQGLTVLVVMREEANP